MRLSAALALTVVLAGCHRALPLADAHDTAQGLARAVLAAVAVGDRARLEALALNESEFRGHVWLSLPAAREARNLPFSYVWGDLRQKSAQSLSKLLAEHRREPYDLVDVMFEGETDFGPYTVHRESTFVVRLPSGETESVRLAGSMIEKDGDWKVFSYVVDD